MSAEDEFTLGLFLQGKTVYNYMGEDNPRTNLFCLNCKRCISMEGYGEYNDCPNCRTNAVIALEGRNVFNKLKVEVLREKIILDVLQRFDFGDILDMED